MRNYLITEHQFKRILETVETEKDMSLRQAMKLILGTLKEKGYEDEQVVDFMIALRTGDPYVKHLSKQFELDPLFRKAVERLTLSVEV